jgi:hypothetical protein
MVWIEALESIWRMRWLPVSPMVRRVEGETTAERGLSTLAAVAAAPSPAKPWVPSPAMVVILPVAVSTRRMRWFAVSAM